VIVEDLVLVNGQVKSRKRKKIVSGDIVEFDNEKLAYN
jgi:ribosome-associated protein YbcJ (S4-like RNA binding protein)